MCIRHSNPEVRPREPTATATAATWTSTAVTNAPTSTDVARQSRLVAARGDKGSPGGLPGIKVDLAAGQSAVEDLQCGLTRVAGRPAVAAGQQPRDQPHDQPEQDKPEETHGKPCAPTHTAAIPTHHGELLTRLPGVSGTTPASRYRAAFLARNHEETMKKPRQPNRRAAGSSGRPSWTGAAGIESA